MKLNEFIDKNGNKVNITQSPVVSNKTSSGSSNIGYKKRFEKLLDCHIGHKDKDVSKVLVKDIKDYAFHYSEQHKGEFEGGYKKDVVASFNKDDSWRFMVFMDNKEISEKYGSGWDTFIWEISFYLNLPELTTDPEYQELLEWVDSNGKTIHVNNSPAPSKPSSTPTGKIPDQTYRYKRLLAQIDADGFCKYTINNLDESTLDITLHNGVDVKLERNNSFPIYTLTVEDTSQSFDDYEDVLKALIEEGIIGETDLCENLTEWQSTPALKTEHYSGTGRVRQKTRETVQKIIVDPGVEEIYNNTFSYCEELQEVVLPDTLTRIDNFAFYACRKLAKINLPNSISFIAAQAFESCPKVVIYCEKGSYAEEFAKDRSISVSLTTSITEWLDNTGNKININNSSVSTVSNTSSTKTNKERFKELTNYMIKNKSSNVYKAEVVRLDEGGFTYKEYRKSPSGQDFTFTLLVGYSRFGPQWKYELYMDKALEEEKSGNGFNYLLFELYKYFKVPAVGSSEHDDICESISFAESFREYENLWD